MKLHDISILIGFIGIYDLRVQVDELKVRAWNESLDSDIPLDEAKKIVSWHYSNFDSAINPSHINREWRRRLADARERERSRLISLEFEENEKRKASPEFVTQIKKELLEKLNRGKDASLESDNGQVASDS
jgi:dsRNA-specific ribonuclease